MIILIIFCFPTFIINTRNCVYKILLRHNISISLYLFHFSFPPKSLQRTLRVFYVTLTHTLENLLIFSCHISIMLKYLSYFSFLSIFCYSSYLRHLHILGPKYCTLVTMKQTFIPFKISEHSHGSNTNFPND